MLNLPEFSPDRILRRCVLWVLILCFIAVGYLAYRHERNRARATRNANSPLKVLVDPESALKDL
jgi:cbb3-type cytochrome oxidase subunit 3